MRHGYPQTARKTLNPVWNEQLKCDVTDDCLLQDEPLQLRIFDYDVLSADDVIGTVYVHCNSLYMSDKRQIFGWYPIYDTLRGICGELQLKVYIQHIMDFNPVEDSSVGVSVFAGSLPPSDFYIAELHGLVDELVVEDDPENDWQDNFRSSRTSNDARQLLLHVMDGRLRRQIGRKVTDCGGNALLGYQTQFDMEDNFIIARGVGTAVALERVPDEPERDVREREREERGREREPTLHPPSDNNLVPGSRRRSRSPHDEVGLRRECSSEGGEAGGGAESLGVGVGADVGIYVKKGQGRDKGRLLGERETRDSLDEGAGGGGANGDEYHHGELDGYRAADSRDRETDREEEIEPVPQAQLRTLHRSKVSSSFAAVHLVPLLSCPVHCNVIRAA